MSRCSAAVFNLLNPSKRPSADGGFAPPATRSASGPGASRPAPVVWLDRGGVGARDSFFRNGYLKDNGRFRFGLGPAGLKLPPTVSNDAVMTYWLHGVMPELARSTWEALRRTRLTISGGRASLRTAPIDHLDVGSYRKSDGWAWVNVCCAAREMGDDEAAHAVEAAIDERFESERSAARAHKLADVSTWVNCAYALSGFMSDGSMRRLINGELPPEWKDGPMLAAAGYPDVLVAKAVSDGTGLALVLRPGAGPVRTTLRLARLIPGRQYRVDAAAVRTLTADATGRAALDIDLADRLALRLTPQS